MLEPDTASLLLLELISVLTQNSLQSFSFFSLHQQPLLDHFLDR